jgi:ABC-type sugar transport system substrate-binding protein
VKQGLAVSFIGFNEAKGGALVGSAMRAALKTGDVAILEGAAGDAPAISRTKGFKSALAGSGLKIVAASPGDWARDKGLTVATDMLTAHPNLKGIFAHNDEMAFGALAAISAAGKKGDIYLASYNGTCIGLQAALKGDFQVEGILFLEDEGRRFVRQAVAYLGGKKVPKRDILPILALRSSQLRAVLKGTKLKGVPSSLRARLQDASKGKC